MRFPRPPVSGVLSGPWQWRVGGYARPAPSSASACCSMYCGYWLPVLGQSVGDIPVATGAVLLGVALREFQRQPLPARTRLLVALLCSAPIQSPTAIAGISRTTALSSRKRPPGAQGSLNAPPCAMRRAHALASRVRVPVTSKFAGILLQQLAATVTTTTAAGSCSGTPPRLELGAFER
jgi:hypothetical protein